MNALTPTVPAKSRTTRQLEILAIRSFELAERVEAGEVEFLDAIDVPMTPPTGPALLNLSAIMSCKRFSMKPSVKCGGRHERHLFVVRRDT